VTARDRPVFEVGRVVADRYELCEIIGQGTTGTVYKARDLYVDTENEIVAIKAIHPHLHGDRQIFGRFRREVAILRRLEGRHVCKLLDCIEEAGLCVMVLEYVDGPSLDEYLRDRSLPLREVVAIMLQVCTGLEAAHERGVVHRDLKPSNVLVEGVRGREIPSDEAPLSFLHQLSVRVVDFGLAKVVAGDGGGTNLTERDMIFGTPDYMAPEQVVGDDVDQRCDVYAVGVMLYEMVVGRVPFNTPGALSTMAAHVSEPVPSPRNEVPSRSVPATLEQCILKALAKKRDERYASARELREALALADVELGAPSSDEAEPAQDTQLEQSRTALSTTMPSDPGSVDGVRRGARVRVIVRDAPGAGDSDPPPPRPEEPPSLGTPDDEGRFWTWAALVAAILAVAAGIWLGVR
jgi:eukaryotic-like serine/threonine-protein kinase